MTFDVREHDTKYEHLIGRQTGALLEARYIFVRQGVRARW